MALSRNEIKFIKSLQDKKTRELEQCFVVEGVKLVNELLEHTKFTISQIYCLPDYTGELPSDLPITTISQSELERISGLINPNKVLAVVHMPEERHEQQEQTGDKNLILFLDDVRDPGNLGTIIRTADWFGVTVIYASNTTVDLYNPKVIQASMGAVYRIQFAHCNLPQKLDDLKKSGYQLIGADMSGTSLYSFQFASKTALVMGSESHGISSEIQQLLNERITIPRFGKTESLNVGIATGIILSHYHQP